MLSRDADGFVLDADGFAVPSADLLADFFAEHSDDPNEGAPESWPAWTDEVKLAFGAPSCREERIDDPDPDQALTPEEQVFEPGQADINFLLDQAERRVYERGCNMHFAP